MEVNLLLCIFLTFGACKGLPVEEWEHWKLKYSKTYKDSEEENVHRQIWLKHYQAFAEHQSKEHRDFKMEMNEFSDQILPRTGFQLATLLINDNIDDYEENELTFVPDSWDWRQKGAITPVRNQGQLGDALSMAATACVESYHFIQDGKMVALSTGEMHDCCTAQPVLSRDVFTCVHNIGGLCSRSDYPAAANICRNTTCTPVAKVNGGKQSPSGDEEALMETVYQSPALVGVDASHASFQLYRSGVYSERACSATRLDHALQVVGYGSQDGTDYWICKNSWGVSWGMQGYILIARNHGNMCGIATSAYIPV